MSYMIHFNGKTFAVPEAALNAAFSQIHNHLSTVMNGTGATINFDGASYSVDSTKLATATDTFVSYLGTIAGSGEKVVVNGTEHSVDSAKLQDAFSDIEAVLAGTGEERLEGDGAEYYTLAPTALSFRSTAPLNELQEVQINGVTVDPSNYTLEEGSTIVTFPIEYLKTLEKGNYEVDVVSDSKIVKGGFTVAAPELNEYGFYYNQPYTAYVDYFQADTVFLIRENGTVDVLVGDVIETCPYTIDGNSMTVATSEMGDVHLAISTDGIECIELATNFVLENEFAAADEDYIYIYKENLGGYEVNAIDKKKAEYGAIKTGINGIDTVKLADYIFSQNENLTSFHQISNSVTIIGMRAFFGCRNLSSVTIPDSVTIILSDAFSGTSLTSIEIPASVNAIDFGVFNSCESLTSISVASANTRYYSVDGILYETHDNKKSIIKFPSAYPVTSFVIPNDVEYIYTNAFVYCNNLSSVTIPNGAHINGEAFSNCTNLTSIIYEGTIGELMSNLPRNVAWNVNIPATYVQCSDGTVPTDLIHS